MVQINSKLLLIVVVGLAVIASGCTGGQDVTSIVKALPEVQQFMKEHPNAKITVTYWSKEEVAQSVQEISQQCDKPITPMAMYKATVNEGDLKIVSWINAENKIVICSATEGRQTPTPITAIATATVTTTPIPTGTATTMNIVSWSNNQTNDNSLIITVPYGAIRRFYVIPNLDIDGGDGNCGVGGKAVSGGQGLKTQFIDCKFTSFGVSIVNISISNGKTADTKLWTVNVLAPTATPIVTGNKILVDSLRGFIPDKQKIKVSDEVIWENMGIEVVTLVSNEGLFENNQLESGKQFRYTFIKPGTYGFYLNGNKNLNGIIIVESMS